MPVSVSMLLLLIAAICRPGAAVAAGPEHVRPAVVGAMEPVHLPTSAPAAGVVALAWARWVVVTDSGEVWVTEDEGHRWRLTLGAAPASRRNQAEEDPLRAELARELFELEVALDGLGADALLDDAAWGLEEIAARSGSSRDPHAGAGSARLGAMAWPRLWAMGDQGLLLSRGDGLWWLAEHDARWRRVQSQPATAAAPGPPGVMFVGDEEGLWRLDVRSGARTRVVGLPGPVRGVLTRDGELVAVTDGGVWHAHGPRGWTPAWAGRWRGLVDSVVAVGSTLWVASDEDLVRIGGSVPLRRDEIGDAGGGALARRGADGLARVQRGEVRLLRGSDGALIGRLPGIPRAARVHGLVATPRVLVATDAGLYAEQELVPGGRPCRFDRGELPPLGSLLSWAGQAYGAPWVGRARFAAAGWLPQLVVEARHHGRWVGRTSATSGPRGDVGAHWGAWVRLVWTPPRALGAQSLWGEEADEVDVEDLRVVLEGGGFAVAPHRTARAGAAELTAELRRSEVVRGLWRRWEALTIQLGTSCEVDLPTRVALELRLDEVQAQLDVLTEGAVSRWRGAAAHAGAP